MYHQYIRLSFYFYYFVIHEMHFWLIKYLFLLDWGDFNLDWTFSDIYWSDSI